MGTTCPDTMNPLSHVVSDRGGHVGKQVKCGSTETRSGKRCQKPAMIGYSRCQLHRGAWTPVQKKKTKKR